MNSSSFDDLPPLDLVERLIRNRRDVDQTRKGGSIWSRGAQWLLRRTPDANELRLKLDELKAESQQLNRILRQHYEGIVGEVFRRGSGSGIVLPSKTIQEFSAGIFLQFPQQIATLTDPLRFSVVLWKTVDVRLNTQFGDSGCAAAMRLKPKFMLRQFVDDLPNGDARGTLRSLAYIAAQDPVDNAILEARALLQNAYRELHEVLWRNRKSLAVRTDNTISVTRKQPHPADLAEYEHWLFLTRNS